MSPGDVLPGTSIDGIELGGQSRERAATLIDGIEPRQVELSKGTRSFTVRAPQAGLTIDSELSAEYAASSGRSGVGTVISGPLSLFLNREIQPQYEPVDSKRLAPAVDRIADRIDREPFVGALSIDPATLEVATEQPETGVGVRRRLTAERLLTAFRAGRGTIEIPVRRRPAPSQAEVESVALEAERYLRKPLRVRSAGTEAVFPPEQVAGLLAIESGGERTDGGTGSGIRLGADPGLVEALVSRFAASRDRQARDAGLDTPAQPPVTVSEQGDLSWSPKPGVASVREGRPGRRVLQAQAVEATTEAIRDGRHRVRFRTERVAPGVTTREAKDATSLLGTFTTSYSCCEPRVTNIQRMAETVDGTVIGPGEQFSLNGIAGERTRANGYKPAPTIGEGNELIDTVGGSVSQFSTTTYNAAYFSGLQIDAHTPHSFYISRYPPGRESTLNFGTIDLLWTNDTSTPVVVRSSASDTSVTVSMYGGNGGRRVKAETRSRSDNDQGGFDMTVDRVVIGPDGSREREPFTTIYGLPAE